MGVTILRLIRVTISIVNIYIRQRQTKECSRKKGSEEIDASVCVTWVERTATCKECKEFKEIKEYIRACLEYDVMSMYAFCMNITIKDFKGV